MIASPQDWLRPARRRRAANLATLGAPLVLTAALLASLLGGGPALAVAVMGAMALGWWTRRAATQLDMAWLVRRLDADPRQEDSADLLFAPAGTLGPLQQLQQARVAARLAATPHDLRPAWSVQRIVIAWAVLLIVLSVVVAWRARSRPDTLAPATEGNFAPPGVPRLVGQRLRVVPPAYTGLPPRDLDTLDARAPAGSRLVWTLAFAPTPTRAGINLVDGRNVSLAADRERWRAALILDRSWLYRVEPAGAPAGPLHRLEAVPDRPPQVTARGKRLTLARPGLRTWAIAFDATDDYGVAATARLRLSVAAGEGENLQFSERVVTLQGTGPARARRFAATLDLGSLGLNGPGDLVARLTVSDGCQPQPHIVEGPSLILRRPPANQPTGTGVSNVMPTPLPAYLRSQRQIIIDAEALLRQRRALPQPVFLDRSMRIGDDQAALRGRYGQLLGAESEGADAGLPTADAPTTGGFGKAGDPTAEYGHAHDQAEGATLFDPQTRATLKSAVEAMWQSEGALQQGDPARALPFAYKALGFIKQAQRATRVFVAKVGSELPPVDEARRLTGKRDDIAANDLALPPRVETEAGAAAAWAAIDGAPGHPMRLDVLEHWLNTRGRTGDPLALAGAIDAVRRTPGCEACRARLRALVWRELDRPPPGVLRRDDGTALGRAYLGGIAR